jgi:hypothetical protein
METVADKPASQPQSGTVPQAAPQADESLLAAAGLWFIAMGLTLAQMRAMGEDDLLFAEMADAVDAGGGRP